MTNNVRHRRLTERLVGVIWSFNKTLRKSSFIGSCIFYLYLHFILYDVNLKICQYLVNWFLTDFPLANKKITSIFHKLVTLLLYILSTWELFYMRTQIAIVWFKTAACYIRPEQGGVIIILSDLRLILIYWVYTETDNS